MPETVFFIYPKDPIFAPEPDDIEQCLRHLRGLLPACSVVWNTFDSIQFLHCGSALRSVTCPHCGQTLSSDVWHDMMDSAYDPFRFADLSVVMPCCETVSALNELIYVEPCGFSRHACEIRPDTPDGTDAVKKLFNDRDGRIDEVGRILRCPAGCGLVHVAA
jgi:hypothetical protein